MGYQIDGIRYINDLDGGRLCTFNDPTDSRFVGFVQEATGTDGPEVRENTVDLTEADGGKHGAFYHGRRVITWRGFIPVDGGAADWNAKMDQIAEATNAMRSDIQILWFEDNDDDPLNARMAYVRRQQRPNFGGDRPKTFLLSFVSERAEVFYPHTSHPAGDTEGDFELASPYGYSDGLIFPLTFDMDFEGATYLTATLHNPGTATAYPKFTLPGAYTYPRIYNATNGGSIQLAIETEVGDELVIDHFNRTVTLNGEDAYEYVQFPESTFWGLPPGDNVINVTWRAAAPDSNPSYYFLPAYI